MNGLDTISRLVLASRNAKKCAEMRDLLSGRGMEVVGLDAFPGLPEVLEDGETFAQNARKKAAEVARQVSQWTLGEDSGLEVDALGGAPGVYSARYAGEPSNDLANNQKLLAALAGVPPERRGARYVCRIAVADSEGQIRLECEGFCRGRIVDEPRGTHGFGYDPHFLISEYHRTFGELGPLVKQAISHRARAFEQLLRGLAARTPANHLDSFAPTGPNSTARGNAPGFGANTTRQP